MTDHDEEQQEATTLTKVKTTEDGVDIYLDTDTGRFEATYGCTCSTYDLRNYGGHSPYCKRKTARRKTLAEIERALQPDKPRAAVRAISMNRYSGGSSLVNITNVESNKGYRPRYRDADGDLFSEGTDIRAYDEAAWLRLKELEAQLKLAGDAYEAFSNDPEALPELTLAKLRELQKAQRDGVA